MKYDEIGYWSEIKLDIVREYAAAYSKILSAQKSPSRQYIYIDAFAGSGMHLSKSTGEFIQGSPLNALLIKPPFIEGAVVYYLFFASQNKAGETIVTDIFKKYRNRGAA